ncbi:SLC13 family permease [Rosistilla oblonga]|uniref:SLC13 family permease n=1 Tax=Rosistilla oblonga TaxID=2527990 RepID=UPI003A96EE4D
MMFSCPKSIMLPGGVVVAALVGAGCSSAGLEAPACWCAATSTLCAMWWIFEVLPIAATALLPFVVFPLTGVLDHRTVATAYGHTMILLLMGGFLLSAAMERSGAHRRLAMIMVRAVGGRGERRIVLGFMLATAMLSMWISNTATTLMMLPIAMAVLERHACNGLRVPLLLGIAYSASVGGMGTPVGTPPNAMFMGFYEEKLGRSLAFVDWMVIAVPIVAILLPIIWLWLTRNLKSDAIFEMPDVGAWRSAEVRVLIVFSLTALAWITRTTPFDGWSYWIGATTPNDAGGITSLVGDSTVALAATLALFIIPSGGEAKGPLLDWETAERIPWGILLLFGGGLALAKGFDASGLSTVIGDSLAGLASLPPILVIGGVCLLVTFLTEITSGTATTALLLPILASTAIAADVPAEMIMIPGTISASCAFMLPVATAPNTIVYGAGGLSTGVMARTGLVLNLIAVCVITTFCWLMLS